MARETSQTMAYKTFRRIDRPTLYILHVRAVRRKLCAALVGPEREREGGSKRPPKVTLAAHCAALPLYIVPDVSGIRIENRYGRTRGTSVRSSLPLSNGRSAFALTSLDVRLVELVLNLPFCLCTLELLPA